MLGLGSNIGDSCAILKEAVTALSVVLDDIQYCRLGNDAVLKEGFTKRQYTEDEILSLTGTLPPVMSVFLREAVAIMPDEAGRTVPLREALPKAIRKLQLILNFIEPPEPNSPNNTPTPSAPLAA